MTAPRLYQRDVRPQLLGPVQRLGTGRRCPDNGDVLPLQQAAGGRQELRAVVDDQAPHARPPGVAG